MVQNICCQGYRSPRHRVSWHHCGCVGIANAFNKFPIPRNSCRALTVVGNGSCWMDGLLFMWSCGGVRDKQRKHVFTVTVFYILRTPYHPFSPMSKLRLEKPLSRQLAQWDVDQIKVAAGCTKDLPNRTNIHPHRG